MGAPAGNSFWMLRAKDGRNKLFETPELLWKAACEYFQSVDDNPFIVTDFKGGMAVECKIPKQRPYTIEGLCIFCHASRHWWNEFRKSCETKEDQDFLEVITRIDDIIRDQKYSGAVSGIFNGNIIARDLGLAEKQDFTGNLGINWHEEKNYGSEQEANNSH